MSAKGRDGRNSPDEQSVLRRVLVVDDEPDILAVIRITLRTRGGFEVEVCQSGEEAVETARRFAPDLVLLDVMMPGMDGPTTLRALRDDPETAPIPIVFLTAKTTGHDTDSYLDLGAAAVIAKPFDQRTLVDELERIARQAASATAEETDPELLELLDTYEQALPAKVREIRELWARLGSAHDADTARILYRRVHNLAGTAATFGHPVLSDAARRLEQEIAGSEPDRLEPSSNLRHNVEGLIDALDAAAGVGRARWRTH
jgi:two-component system OmpR family response regulator